MKITIVTAGAAGMYCGSCMHDNTLAAALIPLGHETLLVPTYTPISTDEEDVSQGRVFFGGINVYLQQKSWLFRVLPRVFARLLDAPRLLKWVSRFAAKTPYHELGELTLSMLAGRDGKQRREVRRLADWLKSDAKPDIILFSNILLSGAIPEIKRRLDVPILASLQGDDVFLDALPGDYRERAKSLIRANAADIAGYLTPCADYADHMADYLGLPRGRMHPVFPGLKLAGHGGPRAYRAEAPYTVGYFARVCPEKGFQHFVSAFIALCRRPDAPPGTRAKVGGWLGEGNRAFYVEQLARLDAAGLGDRVERVDCPTHADKVAFLRSIDVFSVPTEFREPKGLYVLESLANGTPVVQPARGSFPELIAATGGGMLVPPGDADALAAAWAGLLNDPEKRRTLGEAGQRAVAERFTARRMAEETLGVLSRYR